MSERRGGWICTQSGRKFYPLDSRPDELDIRDIAHALSLLCRFGGHCRRFYSVAEHSWHVSYLVPRHYALCALLHDATEAYIVDVPRPIKQHLPGYQKAEARLWVDVAARFSLPLVMPQEVHDADIAAALAEGEQLLPNRPPDWGQGYTTPVEERPRIRCWDPDVAYFEFLDRYEELTSE